MNFAALKVGFIKYLESEGIVLSAKEKRELNSSSIFLYQEEFREFLNKEHDIDIDTLSFDFSDSSALEFKNGKINNPDLQEDNLTLDIFNNLLEDEEFIALLDSDDDKALNEEEIQHFLKFANTNDGDEENLSINDLFKGYEKAKEGKYDKSGIKTTTPSSSTSGSYSGSYSPTNSNGLDKKDKDKNSIQNMSYDELQNSKNEKRTAINNERAKLNQTYANDQESVNNAKTAYDEAISNDNIAPELKTARDANIEAIAAQDKLISSLKTTLNNLDGQISSKQSELDSITSSKQALTEALTAINTFSTENSGVVNLAQGGDAQMQGATLLGQAQTTLGVEIQNEITTKREDVTGELQTIEANETRLIQELEDLKTQKTTAEGNLTTAQGDLAKYESEKETIDAQILQNCSEETRIALENYNKARETAKNNAKTGEENIKLAETELSNIEKEINTRDAKSIKNKYAISAGQVFDENSTLNWNYIKGETKYPYGIIAPDNVNPNEKLPVLVFMHGTGEISNVSGLERIAHENFMTDLENFRGYIICPQLTGGRGSWNTDEAMKAIGEIINSVGANHNIDYDNIAMSGHSLGGMGTIYASKDNRFEKLTGIKISKSVILSGYTDSKISNFDMDTKIYVGGGGDATSVNQMKNNIVDAGGVSESDYHVLSRSSHGSLDQDAFNLDEDGNNRSDIFEWLFENKDSSGYYRKL